MNLAPYTYIHIHIHIYTYILLYPPLRLFVRMSVRMKIENLVSIKAKKLRLRFQRPQT